MIAALHLLPIILVQSLLIDYIADWASIVLNIYILDFSSTDIISSLHLMLNLLYLCETFFLGAKSMWDSCILVIFILETSEEMFNFFFSPFHSYLWYFSYETMAHGSPILENVPLLFLCCISWFCFCLVKQYSYSISLAFVVLIIQHQQALLGPHCYAISLYLRSCLYIMYQECILLLRLVFACSSPFHCCYCAFTYINCFFLEFWPWIFLHHDK